MPVKMEMESTKPKAATQSYRPPKDVLDLFWTLADGTDEQRNYGTVRIVQLLKDAKEEEKAALTTYCRDRLVKGLSSGRKFARVGFAGALSQLLREQQLQTSDVITAIQEKLKPQRHEKSSKSEVGGIYLGRAFGFSTIIQSGTLSAVKAEALATITEELVTLAERKSYLRAVCHTTLEDLASQVSTDEFGEHVWPKLRDKLKQGWDSCTLDVLSLLLKCRSCFPDVVNKKFLKKHWGYPLLSEENDEKLLKATLDTEQRASLLLDKIVPCMLAENRDAPSIWNGLGEKLMETLPDKKADVQAHRRVLGLKLAARLLSDAASTQQVLDVVLSAQTARCLFHNITRKEDPLAIAAATLFDTLCAQLKPEGGKSQPILPVVEQVWRLEASLVGDAPRPTATLELVTSSNFTRLLNQMTQEETKTYTETLMAMIKGKDKWEVMSEHPPRKAKQVETCLRQLQHVLTSPVLAVTPDLQADGLALLLRLAYFRVDKKVKAIQHCESCVNLEEDDPTRKLCEALLLKSLNTISTVNTGHQKRSERDSSFIKLLFKLCQYTQELQASEKVNSIQTWSEAVQEDWAKVYKLVSQLKKSGGTEMKSPGSAFLLLLLYLGLQMLSDHQTASNLLQDVSVCYEKAFSGGKVVQETEDSEEPAWVEVLTEVLLHLMSLPSHLGRVVTASVFRLLTGHMTPQAVALITEVLIPKKTRGDDAGGVMVEGADDDEDEDDDDDIPEEASDDDDADDEEVEEAENDDDDKGGDEDEDENEDVDMEEEEDIEVDEQFRESVKQALGQAADLGDSDEEEKELSDMSDSEMFKLDDMLAEVFRQRKKAGAGRKVREEKRAELANFRLRVLDLVENMIKSDRSGDFLLDLVRPLLLLTLRSSHLESQAVSNRAQALFTLLKSKAKAVKDTVHTMEEQNSLFQEMLELAQKTSDPTHMQTVAMACYIVMNISCKKSKGTSKVESCMDVFQQTLSRIIAKKQSKPHISFFTSVIEINPVLFCSVSKNLLSNLNDESIKVHNKTLCCSVLTSLCRRVDSHNPEPEEAAEIKGWILEAATITSQMLKQMEKGDIKTMLVKEMLQLMLALLAHPDSQGSALDLSVKQKLADLKSKFNTDLRRLANKVIGAIDRAQNQANRGGKKKRKSSKNENDVPEKKKLKARA